MSLIRLLLLCATILCGLNICRTAKSAIEYLPEQLTFTSNDESRVFGITRVQRVKRGVYGAYGNFTLLEDLVAETMVEAKTYRSALGNNQYVATPFAIKKTPITEIMNDIYRKYIYEVAEKCTTFHATFPWKPPVKKGVYQLDACTFESEKLPQMFQPGYYKFVLEVTKDKLKVTAVAVVQIQKTIN